MTDHDTALHPVASFVRDFMFEGATLTYLQAPDGTVLKGERGDVGVVATQR